MIFRIRAYVPNLKNWHADFIVVAETEQEACDSVRKMGRMDAGVKAKRLPLHRESGTAAEIYSLDDKPSGRRTGAGIGRTTGARS
jgi:hypothetical protein